jgi:hypothetical protein
MKWTICYLWFFALNFQLAWLRVRSNSVLSIGLVAHNSVVRCEVFVPVSTFELKVYSVSAWVGILPDVPFRGDK